MPFDLAIVVVHDRAIDRTLDCLASLAGEIGPGVRALVINGDSDDAAAERVERAIDQRGFSAWTSVLRSPEARGFAACLNLGIRSAPARAHLVVRSDIRLRAGALRALRSAASARPDAGIIAGAVLDERGRPVPNAFRDPAPASELLRSGDLGSVRRMLSRFDIALPQREQPSEPDWVSFACALIQGDVIERIGLLDEAYIAHFEDADYCRRARDAGFKILRWPAAEALQLAQGPRGGAGGVRHRRASPSFHAARARYFAKFYGRAGLWTANALWHLGRCVSLPRELLGETRGNGHHDAEHENGHSGPARGEQALKPLGSANENPDELSLLSLIAEDFRTHDRNPLEPGFLAVALHRLGNARMDLQPRLLRAPFSLAYRAAFLGSNWLWGIDLPYTVKLGRRVRIWHHGGIVLNARAIGDDVHIRHNTTFGIARRDREQDRPVIGSRVDIGVGACVLGAVNVGDDCVIGANSVVLDDLPAGSTAVGAPARPVHGTLEAESQSAAAIGVPAWRAPDIRRRSSSSPPRRGRS